MRYGAAWDIVAVAMSMLRRRERLRPSEIAALALFAFDGLKKRLEISLPEAAAALALNDLEEQRWPVLHRAGEDLQHISLIVAIDQDAQLLQLVHGLVDRAHALLQFGVIGVRDPKEF